MNILKWPSKIILLSIILVNCGESVDSRDINCIGTSGNTCLLYTSPNPRD